VKVLVSACLAGINCRFDGKNELNKKIRDLVERGKAICVCPEELGGLPTPRTRSEIKNATGSDVLSGKAQVINREGKDITENFTSGAGRVLEIAKKYKIKKAIFKSKSPACGKGKIYDGSFSGRLKEGDGVTTALLLKNNIKVVTEEDIS
jgi:uncharacterized protein YbbK (DUF523 family)